MDPTNRTEIEQPRTARQSRYNYTPPISLGLHVQFPPFTCRWTYSKNGFLVVYPCCLPRRMRGVTEIVLFLLPQEIFGGRA